MPLHAVYRTAILHLLMDRAIGGSENGRMSLSAWIQPHLNAYSK
jgi:hypothetical protein